MLSRVASLSESASDEFRSLSFGLCVNWSLDDLFLLSGLTLYWCLQRDVLNIVFKWTGCTIFFLLLERFDELDHGCLFFLHQLFVRFLDLISVQKRKWVLLGCLEFLQTFLG